jgi:hypothetical protein
MAALDGSVSRFIQAAPVADYLRVHHDFDQQSAARWVHLALRDMDAGRLIPSAAAALDQLSGRTSAPLAIWLGILLDGIPESLVIGASLIHRQRSLSSVAETIYTGWGSGWNVDPARLSRRDLLQDPGVTSGFQVLAAGGCVAR